MHIKFQKSIFNNLKGWNRSQSRKQRTGLKPFLTKNRTGDGTVLRLRTPRTERRTERNGTERNENGTIEKKGTRTERSIAEGSRSRTERNDLKKVGTCPALTPYRV